MSKESKEFIKELKALLKKYNAEISFECSDCSDTHGIYGEKIRIYKLDKLDKQYNTLVSVDGWQVNAENI